MAKEYFQDITPPSGDDTPPKSPPPPTPPSAPADAPPQNEPPSKTIRNIQVSATRQKLQGGDGDRGASHAPPAPPKKHFARYALWGGSLLAILVLAALALVALRPTSVTVIPRSHTVLFDETARFTAFPVESAATTTTLTFKVETITLDDSQVVPAEGVEEVEERANGTITVFNNYSTSPVNLIKNTRFETPSGLVFRAPSETVIPGKRGSTPGEISVTVIADKPGQEYNVGPIDTFRLPGLASTPDMYQGVYASSNSAMKGGFSGERPTADPAALEAAQSEIRNRLESRAHAAAQEHTSSANFAFVDLARVTYKSLAPTPEGEGNVRLNERLTMELPVFSADEFAYLVGENVSAGVEEGAIVLEPGEGFTARFAEVPTSLLAISPLVFTLEGTAQLVWKVDTDELGQTLAGRDEAAFQAIVEGFPGIEEARARIEPFWKRSFPSDPSDIKITVEDPTDL